MGEQRTAEPESEAAASLLLHHAESGRLKAITAFSFAGLEPAVVGTIDEEAKTIALTVPNGTVVTALVATFINSEKSSVKVGEVAQESGVTANDFTTPVEYVVTAEDETTSTYTVTVTIAEAN